MSMEIDHVIFCVTELDTAARLAESEHGLSTVPGGKHTGHGTENRIVPLGSSYLELVAVADEEEAQGSGFGRWVKSNASPSLTGHGLCLRTDDLDAICGRLGIEPISMSRQRPDGQVLRWRIAGLERMIDDGLPFFIEWQVPSEDHPGRAPIAEASGQVSVEVVLSGDPMASREWAGGVDGLSLRDGRGAVESVIVRLGDRILEL